MLNDEERYRRYVEFCARVGVVPRDFDEWMAGDIGSKRQVFICAPKQYAKQQRQAAIREAIGK